jgi:hypothetical protein
VTDPQGPKGANESDSSRDDIDAILETYHSATLWEMARAAGLEVTDSRGKRLRKAELLPRIRAEFFTKKRVLSSVRRLDERERAVLDRLLLRGGTAATRSLKREAVRARLATSADKPKPGDPYEYYNRAPYAQGYSGHPERPRSRVFEDVVARLTHRGLVFSQRIPMATGGTPYKAQFHPGATLFVPHVVQQYLSEPEPVPLNAPDWQPEQVQIADPGLLLRDLYLYWDHARRNDVTLLKSGLVGKRGLKAINDVLLVPDPLLQGAKREDQAPRLFLLRRLLEQLDLVRGHRGQLQMTGESPDHIPAFWSWPLVNQLKACLESWFRLGAIGAWEKEAAQYSPRYRHARETVCATLQKLETGIWLEPEDLLERLQDHDSDFLFAERSKVESYRGSWYYSHSGSNYYGSTRDLLRAFDEYEGRFLATWITGFLHQLGIVDVGRKGETWQAFRLTEIGRAVLDAEDTQPSDRLAEEGQGKLVIQPNFQIVAMGPVGLDCLARLDLIADRKRADRGAFEYHITRDSIYRAHKLGMEVDEVIHFLEEATGVTLPQNIRRSLQEWGAQHERIVFRSGVSLLQAADADFLTKLLDDSRVSRYLDRQVSSEVALLNSGHERSVVAELVSQGILPAVSNCEPDSADDSVVVDEDGTIRPVQAVPSLYLRGRLSRMAEERTGGLWKLTAASISQAGGSKKAVLHLLVELRRLSREALPSGLVLSSANRMPLTSSANIPI